MNEDASGKHLYLSRLLLNPRSRQVQAELSSAYEMHRTLMRAFPADLDGGPGRVLFRVEEDDKPGPVTILVQSDKKPEWSWLEDPSGYLAQTSDENPSTKELHPNLRSAQHLLFRLRANPTMRRSSDGRRLGLFQEEAQIAWLARKGEAGGFEVRSVRVLPKGKTDQGVIHREEESHRVHMLAVLFEGILEVTNPRTFLDQTLASGIGPGKAFGFGLLSVARAERGTLS